ncbi:MAG: ribosomal protein L13e [Candidatus Hydrothermarchaeales archaeon]
MIRPSVKGDREGRGFSRDELVHAGLPITKAKKLGFAVDLRRRSINNQNIELLKTKSEEIEQELKKKAKAKRTKMPKKVTKEAKKEKPVKVEKKKAVKAKKKPAVKKVSKPKTVKKKEKIIQLTEIKGLGPKTAKRLEDAGVKSATKLLKSDLKKLSEKTAISAKVLEKYVSDASKLK